MRKLCLMTAVLLLLSASALAWEDGVYRDKAPGYGGDVILTVTVRGGKIESLTTENTGGDKSEYYLRAEEALQKAIIAANGIDGVDAVSGATGTSQSILEAMRGILEQAVYNGVRHPGPENSVKEPTLTAWPHQTV